MFDFLFAKYETTMIATIIGGIIALFIFMGLKVIAKTLSDKHPLKRIAKICYEIKLEISVILDWIKGFGYYSIAEYPDYHTHYKWVRLSKLKTENTQRDIKSFQVMALSGNSLWFCP